MTCLIYAPELQFTARFYDLMLGRHLNIRPLLYCIIYRTDQYTIITLSVLPIAHDFPFGLF